MPRRKVKRYKDGNLLFSNIMNNQRYTIDKPLAILSLGQIPTQAPHICNSGQPGTKIVR